MDVKAVMNRFIPNRCALRALPLCALLGADTYATIPAQAKTNFDGNWSVVIITEQGTCDRSYRYPVRISGGTIGYAGQASFDVAGRVAPNGNVAPIAPGVSSPSDIHG